MCTVQFQTGFFLEGISCSVGPKVDTVYTELEDYRLIGCSKDLLVRWSSVISTCEKGWTEVIDVEAVTDLGRPRTSHASMAHRFTTIG